MTRQWIAMGALMLTACGSNAATDAGAEAGPTVVTTPPVTESDAADTCVSPHVRCNQMCTDLQLDTANCGACHNVCPTLDTCRNGICTRSTTGGGDGG